MKPPTKYYMAYFMIGYKGHFVMSVTVTGAESTKARQIVEELCPYAHKITLKGDGWLSPEHFRKLAGNEEYLIEYNWQNEVHQQLLQQHLRGEVR